MRHVRRAGLAAAAFAAAAGVAQAQSPPELTTFSIVACDSVAGFLGVGIQSRVVAAGAIVPAAEAEVGAIATQALANVTYKRRALELLREGRSPDEVRAHFVETDPGIAQRQFALVDDRCRFAAHTGDRTLAWSGHRVGRHYSVQGNILAGPRVIDAMAEAYEAAEAAGLPFGERILASLEAGQDAGGDTRGRQGAGLLIVRAGAGYGGGDDRYADLRVEDHVEPILELQRVYDVWMSTFHPADHFAPGGPRPIVVPVGPHVCLLREMLATAGYAEFGEGRCVYDDEVIRALKAFQRDHDLPVRPELTAAAAARLREVARPMP